MQKPAPPPAHAISRPFAAIGLMVVTFGLFACLDTTAKYLVTKVQLPLFEIVWMRFLGQLIAMVTVLGLVALPSLLRSRKPGMQIVRSFLLLSSTGFNFLALRYLQLDQTTTINFLAPLVTALLAGPLLGEWIGWRRGVAIAVGFCGALVAIRPGFAGVQPAVLWALGTMLSMAFFGIITRHLAAYDRSEVTLFYSLLAGTLVMAPFALADWVWPSSPAAWALLLSMGIYGGLGHYAFIVAHRFAPASTLAPFLYVSLITHSTAGYLVFGQLPDRWTLAGAAIVIATGFYLLHREHVTARAAAVAMTSEAASQR
ncbi:MAG TPA: DMT family transporter [Hyphomicrobiaceae bacterium]|nr:DMT family transporter [Hyphomicrobiaceae bacterium]